MEEWEKLHIEGCLEDLANETRCNTSFITMLTDTQVLGPSDLANLDSPGLTPFQKSEKLYKILIGCPNSFDLLIQSLEATKQTKALQILLDSTKVFGNNGIISYDKTKVLRTGSFPGDIIYKGSFGFSCGRQDVAVKVLNADSTGTKFTLKEVGMLKKLGSHENIMRFFMVEAREGSILVALELFQISLQDEMKLDTIKINAVKVLRESCKGLAYLHSMNVIHTDLNPANILLQKDGQAKISNFGLALQLPTGMERLTVYSENVRNKDWMAPEMLKYFVEDEAESHMIEMSAACDMFSLGCIFFFVLTKGTHPFGNTGFLKQSNIYHDKPRLQNCVLEPNWLQLINRLIAHLPSDRPSSQNVLLDICLTNDDRIPAASSSSGREIPASTENGECLEATTSSTENNSKQLSPCLQTRNLAGTPPVSGRSCKASTSKKRALPSTSQSNDVSTSRRSSSRIAKRQKTSVEARTVGNQNQVIKMEPLNGVDEEGNNKIFRAVLEGKELSELKRIIEQGSDMTIKNAAGETILHLATHHSDPEVIRFFISTGADVNMKDNSGDLPIHKLEKVEHNFKEKLMALCENGANINAKNADGNTLLHLAASAGRSKEDVEIIISNSGNWNWNIKTKNGETVLHLASEGGNPEVIKYLIDLGADVSLKDSSGALPWHRIAFTKLDFKGSLNVFLDCKVDINKQDDDGYTILSSCALNRRPKADLEYIVAKGGDLNLKTKHSQTVLHLAAQVGNVEAIKYFISLGVSINSKANIGRLPLHDLVENKMNFNETLDVLLELGATINSVDTNGDTLLRLAAYFGREKEVLEYIVSKGGNPKQKTQDAYSILHLAALGGNPEAIKYIISLGGKIHGRDREGNTPMHLLANVKRNFRECLDTFLERGAKINAKNKVGHTLLDIAVVESRYSDSPLEDDDLEYIISKGGTGKDKYAWLIN